MIVHELNKQMDIMSFKVLISILLLSTHALGQSFVKRLCKASGHCFTLYTDEGTTGYDWYTSNAFCQKEGHQLASIPDKETQDLIEGLLGEVTSGYVWTSGQSGNDTTWRTLSGRVYTGFVQASELSSCGLLYRADQTVGVTGAYCASGSGAYPLCEVKRDGYCLMNEIGIFPFCYRILEVYTTSWYDARKLCQQYSENSDLAHTHLEEVISEAHDIPQIFHNIQRRLWVGVYKRPWIWRTKECVQYGQLMNYTNWYDSNGNQPGVSSAPYGMRLVARTGFWDDYYVSYKLQYFICEEGGPFASEPCSDQRALPTFILPNVTVTTTTSTSSTTATTTSKQSQLQESQLPDTVNQVDRTTSNTAEVLAGVAIAVAIVCLIVILLGFLYFRTQLRKIKDHQPSKGNSQTGAVFDNSNSCTETETLPDTDMKSPNGPTNVYDEVHKTV